MKFDGDASLIEVVGVSTIVRTDSRKRSPGMFLALDVNLLPADYTEQAFQDTMQVRPDAFSKTLPILSILFDFYVLTCTFLHGLYVHALNFMSYKCVLSYGLP